jgi:hypothetical protein
MPGPDAVVFIGATAALPTTDPDARETFERELRAEIERAYADQGLTAIRYDLQIM